MEGSRMILWVVGLLAVAAFGPAAAQAQTRIPVVVAAPLSRAGLHSTATDDPHRLRRVLKGAAIGAGIGAAVVGSIDVLFTCAECDGKLPAALAGGAMLGAVVGAVVGSETGQPKADCGDRVRVVVGHGAGRVVVGVRAAWD